MKFEKIKLFNRELFLTERKAFDVYLLDEHFKRNIDFLGVMYGDALFLASGLKYNFERLCVKIVIFGNEIKIPFRPFRYFKLKRILSADYLLKNLSRRIILELISRIWFLETGEELGKKKVKEVPDPEKESAETMQQHS